MSGVSEDDAGCWVDGHWGWKAPLRVIQIAYDFGYSGLMFDVENLDDMWDAAEEAEDWLNENIAPEGYSFGWFDGEFFLWSWDEWDYD